MNLHLSERGNRQDRDISSDRLLFFTALRFVSGLAGWPGLTGIGNCRIEARRRPKPALRAAAAAGYLGLRLISAGTIDPRNLCAHGPEVCRKLAAMMNRMLQAQV